MNKSASDRLRPGCSSSSALPTDPDPVVGEVEAFLKDALLQMAPDPVEGRRAGPGRPRVLPALALWAGLLVCVLKGFSSKLDLWRLLSRHQLWFYPRFPVTDQAVYDRLDSAGIAPMEELFGQVSLILKERLAPFALKALAPFAAEVVALDETTLDPVARKLPSLRALPKGDRGLLPGKLAGLFDLRRQQWMKIAHIPKADQNEKVAARTMVEALPETVSTDEKIPESTDLKFPT